jgi:hypothetical protein
MAGEPEPRQPRSDRRFPGELAKKGDHALFFLVLGAAFMLLALLLLCVLMFWKGR